MGQIQFASRYHACKDCSYCFCVPPDYAGEPVCPNCLYDQVLANEPMPKWETWLYACTDFALKAIIAFLAGFAVGSVYARFYD